MFGERWARSPVRARTLVFLTCGVALLLPLIFADWFEIRNRLPRWFFLRAELVFLNVALVAYGTAAVVTALAIPVLLWRIRVAKRRGRPRLPAARGLLGCMSVLVGLVAAEATSAIYQAHAHQRTVIPVGGLQDPPAEDLTARLPPAANPTLPSEFSDRDGDRDVDLVVLGESSAEGVPYQKWFSVGQIVKWQLEQAIPGRTFRLRILARSGDTLERQHEGLARLKRRPELLIVYCGHNEFLSRFFAFRDPPHYFLDQRPSDWERFIGRMERLSPFLGMIHESAEKCRIALPPPTTERELVDVPVYTPGEYSTLLADFRHRLEAIVSYARGLGALPILISPPGNDSDFEPNRSFLPADTPRHIRESFRRAFLTARQLESTDHSASMKQYRDLLARQPGFAEAHYRLAKLLEHAGAWDEAYQHYVEARDHDGFPMRCPSAFQEVYRDVATRQDCLLIDGQSYFHAIGREGLLDDALFQDAVHPSFRGQIALAQAVLSVLHARRAFGWPDHQPLKPIDPATCAAHFGLTASGWRDIANWGMTFNSLVCRLRYDTSERSRRIDAGIAAANQIDAGTAPEALGFPNVGVPAPVPFVPTGIRLNPEAELAIPAERIDLEHAPVTGGARVPGPPPS
jgi:hypothetical protein